MTDIANVDVPALEATVQPLAAVLLYETEQRLIGTLHPLSAGRRERAVIGAGRPLSERDVHEFLHRLAGRRATLEVGWLPAELLALGEDYLVWWSPARVQPMWFLIQGRRYGFRVPWPSLVYVAYRQGLWCAALGRKARPRADTALFHAPLMNIDTAGGVCIGTAEVPESHGVDTLAAWEAVVTASNFAHVNHPHTLALRDSERFRVERAAVGGEASGAGRKPQASPR